MGYTFRVQDEALLRRYHGMLVDASEGEYSMDEWPHDHPPRVNSKALRAAPLPSHISAAVFGGLEPPGAMMLADAIEMRLLTDEDMRRHGRADDLWDMVDWLRYWAGMGVDVRSG